METSNLPVNRAIKILSTYEGANNYILYLKEWFANHPLSTPSPTQTTYIITYSATVPKVARKWVELDEYYTQKMVKDDPRMEGIDKIYIEKLLIEKDKAYHVWGKYRENERLRAIWVPKYALIKTGNTNISVDYSKYAHRPPYDYQEKAIETLLRYDKFILGDDMGVGKTTPAIIAAIESGAKKVLIITTASTKVNWKREIGHYTDKKISILDGDKWEDGDFVILNYSILGNFHTLEKDGYSRILDEGFDLCIIDEAHNLSNSKSNRTKLASNIVKNIKKVWLLTGTPVRSKPIGFYNLLKMIECPIASNWAAYVRRYCGGFMIKRKDGRKIWKTDGATNLEELWSRSSKYMLRRLKSEIGNLPDKIVVPTYIDEDLNDYEKTMEQYRSWLGSLKKKPTIHMQMQELMPLRVLLAKKKVKKTINFCENLIAEGVKVIMFSNFTEPVEEIYRHFGKSAVMITGKTDPKIRQSIVDDFQTNDKLKILCANIVAAGEGLTITSATAAVFNDMSFDPGHHAQAEDRMYRVGQTKDVWAYYMILEGTIEDAMYRLVQWKIKNIRTILGDDRNGEQDVQEMLDEINELRYE